MLPYSSHRGFENHGLQRDHSETRVWVGGYEALAPFVALDRRVAGQATATIVYLDGGKVRGGYITVSHTPETSPDADRAIRQAMCGYVPQGAYGVRWCEGREVLERC